MIVVIIVLALAVIIRYTILPNKRAWVNAVYILWVLYSFYWFILNAIEANTAANYSGLHGMTGGSIFMMVLNVALLVLFNKSLSSDGNEVGSIIIVGVGDMPPTNNSDQGTVLCPNCGKRIYALFRCCAFCGQIIEKTNQIGKDNVSGLIQDKNNVYELREMAIHDIYKDYSNVALGTILREHDQTKYDEITFNVIKKLLDERIRDQYYCQYPYGNVTTLD